MLINFFFRVFDIITNYIWLRLSQISSIFVFYQQIINDHRQQKVSMPGAALELFILTINLYCI